jgi:hypothetical protein
MRDLAIASMIGFCLMCATAARAGEPAEPSAENADPADIISCKITAPLFTGFTMAISMDGETGSAEQRGWVKVPAANSRYIHYHLPKPITVFSQITSDVAQSSNGLYAILDIADPTALAAANGLEYFANVPLDIGGKLVSKESTVDQELKMRVLTSRTLNVSTIKAFPSKTLIGCSYTMDMQPL